MNPRAARWLTALYPRYWQNRYGDEFQQLLQDTAGNFPFCLNVIWSALRERLFPTPGLKSAPSPNSLASLLKHPSAFLPLAASLTALAIVLGHIAILGIPHDADEGAAAHLWQLLIAAQLPVIALFAITYLPRAPKTSLIVLALHAGALLAAMAPVLFLHL